MYARLLHKSTHKRLNSHPLRHRRHHLYHRHRNWEIVVRSVLWSVVTYKQQVAEKIATRLIRCRRQSAYDDEGKSFANEINKVFSWSSRRSPVGHINELFLEISWGCVVIGSVVRICRFRRRRGYVMDETSNDASRRNECGQTFCDPVLVRPVISIQTKKTAGFNNFMFYDAMSS